jgi:hypothetical protein
MFPLQHAVLNGGKPLLMQGGDSRYYQRWII